MRDLPSQMRVSPFTLSNEEPISVDAFAISTSSTVGTLTAFPYKPLDAGTSEIRVLKLPASSSENFELITVSLDDDPKYAALSYLWGDPQDQEIITVQGHEVGVTRNLAAALSRLRRGQSSSETDYLWADAICIDQANPTERCQQVQLMARIYSSAVVVCSWVGPNDYTLAFETLVTLSRLVREKTGDRHHSKYPKHLTFQPEWLRQHHNLCDPKDEPGSLHQGNPWLSIFCLGSEEYWKRIWIFQEVVLARRLLLLSSGDKILEWEDVPLVSSGMNRLASEVHKTRQSKPNHISEKAWRFIIELCPWRRFGLVRIGRLQVQTPSLEHAEYTGWIITNIASRLKATDPRDYIYGLLGVTKIPILPDHTPGKPLSELFVEYVTGWLNATCGRERPLLKPLSFLSVAGVGLFCSSDNLPSWVPNYPGNARRFYTKTFLPRLNHDNSDIPENPAKDPYFVKDTQSLFVWGSKMGPIDTILEERDCNDFQVFYSFLKSFMTRHAHYVSGAPSIQALCQVLRAENESKVVTSTTVMLALCITSLPSSFDRPDPESPPASPWYHEWETRFYDFAFPGIDMQQLGFTRIPAQETLSWSKDQRNQLLSYLVDALHTTTFF